MGSVAIIGSGIVGVCTAIELRKTGHNVTLFDRNEPCKETSIWNAGVLATSSLLPLNNPSLFKKIPMLLSGRSKGFRFDYSSAAKTLPWALRFLANGRTTKFKDTVSDLHHLISLSRQKHEALLSEIDSKESLKREGWMYLYSSEQGFKSAKSTLDVFSDYGIEFKILNKDQIHELEPALTRNFYRAIHLTETFSANPKEIAALYLSYLQRLGGNHKQEKILSISKKEKGYSLSSSKISHDKFDHVIVAAGAWSPQILKSLGISLPMAVERGYLQTFRLKDGRTINRPMYDVENGYVMSPRPDGIQISSGTELTTLGSRPNYVQIDKATKVAKHTLPIEGTTMNMPAIGNRPTLTDSKPAIGPIKAYPGLWLACGHQHIGFGTSAGTGHLLAAQINNVEPEIDPRPYLPSRFGI